MALFRTVPNGALFATASMKFCIRNTPFTEVLFWSKTGEFPSFPVQVEGHAGAPSFSPRRSASTENAFRFSTGIHGSVGRLPHGPSFQVSLVAPAVQLTAL